VRAIQRRRTEEGRDYFARCGTRLWREGMAAPAACADADADGDSGAPIAVGEFEQRWIAGIVYTTEATRSASSITPERWFTRSRPRMRWTANGDSPSIANVDFAGYAEIILGRIVYVLGEAPGGGITVTHILTGTASKGTNGGTSVANQVCHDGLSADIIASMPGLEIVAGATLYKMPATLPTCGTPPCAGPLDIVWNATTVAGNAGRLSGEGFCAVADVWGADKTHSPGPSNRLMGIRSHMIDDGDLTILRWSDRSIISDRNLGGGSLGGAPNVDDFDGDGFLEVASALANFYIVADLQDSTGAAGSCPDWPSVIARKDQANGAHNRIRSACPAAVAPRTPTVIRRPLAIRRFGHCVCLHNGWKRNSDDNSSKVTSSSVFDFNGDGAAEAIYNDECDFRVYDGTSGELLFSQPSRSRTGIENPVVADVDNDGNAEVVTGMNTAATNRCDDDPPNTSSGPNGLRVWGDPTDTWYRRGASGTSRAIT